MLRERNERAAQDSGALSELQEVLDRERGRADDIQVIDKWHYITLHYITLRICETGLVTLHYFKNGQNGLLQGELERQ